MLRRVLRATTVAGLVVAAAGAARADLYTWTDEEGVLHVTNVRPRGRKPGMVVYRSNDSNDRMNGRSGRLSFVPERRRHGGREARPRRDTRSRRNRMADYGRIVAEAAELFQLPASLIWAVIRVESDFNPDAVSVAGAEGLMQLMPATAERLGVTDSFDPRQNIFGGTRYLRILANQFNGDLVLTLAAYNAGEGAVLKAMGVPYDDTESYVRSVLRYYYAYRDGEEVP